MKTLTRHLFYREIENSFYFEKSFSIVVLKSLLTLKDYINSSKSLGKRKDFEGLSESMSKFILN